MTPLQRAAKLFNRAVEPLAASPRWNRLMGGQMAVVRYTGRVSGRPVSLPVTYQRSGERVIISIALPDQKSWWRNFTGDGAPLTLTLDGTDRSGHGVFVRDGEGARVEVVLDEPSA